MTSSKGFQGCWFCKKEEGSMIFCCEFDTYLHLECLRLAAKDRSAQDRELEIILNELGTLL